MTATTDVLDPAQAWARAEQRNDAGALDRLLANAQIGTLQTPAGPPPRSQS